MTDKKKFSGAGADGPEALSKGKAPDFRKRRQHKYAGINPSTLSKDILDVLVSTPRIKGDIEEGVRLNVVNGTQGSRMLRSIVANCVECSGWRRGEAKQCHIVDCALWPYRFGEDPFRKKRTLSQAQKDALEKGRDRSGS